MNPVFFATLGEANSFTLALQSRQDKARATARYIHAVIVDGPEYNFAVVDRETAAEFQECDPAEVRSL